LVDRNQNPEVTVIVEYWSNWLNLMAPEIPKKTLNGGKITGIGAMMLKSEFVKKA
jgi:hypothetical protein